MLTDGDDKFIVGGSGWTGLRFRFVPDCDFHGDSPVSQMKTVHYSELAETVVRVRITLLP
jgi:hypothetical protein